jgi:hypothetical protein
MNTKSTGMSSILSIHLAAGQPLTHGQNIGERARPAKAGMFSGSQSHRGKSQGPVACAEQRVIQEG